MRLNKYISHNSKYSRREADKLVAEGKVKINKKEVKEPFYDVNDNDEVSINGQLIKTKDNDFYTVIVYNKQKGELVTKKDDRGRKTIYDSLPHKFKHFLPVGRLDFMSEGLLILSDSPKVVDALMHSEFERMYKLKISGNITKTMLESMEDGLEIQDSLAGAHELSKIDTMIISPFVAYNIIKNDTKYSKLKVVITEGQNRELRRFFGHFNKEVLDLKRIAFGSFTLDNLPSGKFRYFSKKDYADLKEYLKFIEKEKAKIIEEE
jgi:23S rRNA pseudouridine2605 synthase